MPLTALYHAGHYYIIWDGYSYAFTSYESAKEFNDGFLNIWQGKTLQ